MEEGGGGERVSERAHSAGDGSALPEGAVEVPDNFRNAFLIGRELAIAVRMRAERLARRRGQRADGAAAIVVA